MSHIEDQSDDEQNISRCLYEQDYEYEVEEGEMDDSEVNGSEDGEVEVGVERDNDGGFTIDKIANQMKKNELKVLRNRY